MVSRQYDGDFEDIRPFNDSEFRSVLRRIRNHPWLISAMRRLKFRRWPGWLSPLTDLWIRFILWVEFLNLKTIDQFQRRIVVGRVLEYILRKTSDGVTVSGTEGLSPDVGYLYVSSHRDIVMDSAVLNYVMAKYGLRIAEIAFGDNLLVNEFVSDLIRINRSFVVRRNLPARQKARAAFQLSQYIRHTMTEGNSVWIAQREGRAKDGNDRTNPSIIKMLYLAARRNKMNFQEFVEGYRIVPVSVSYEFDPCDAMKARELHRRTTAGDYRKRKNEDLLSMYAGLKGHKGRIHITFGEPLRGSGFHEPSEVAEAIDDAVHRGYRLWPSNYAAYDLVHGSERFAGEYSEAEQTELLDRLRREKREVVELALRIYAYPVVNALKAGDAE